MLEQKNDNRMAWIRNIEKLNDSNCKSYCVEYEIASECRIFGVLDYEDGKILCGGFSLEKDKNGLFHYLFKIQYPEYGQEPSNKPDKNGYYFRDGILGELLSLFSLYFQCRFYLVATYEGELTKFGLKIKNEEDFLYRKINKAIHPKIFTESGRNFTKGLPDFLKSIIKLNDSKHQNFILACYHYAKSLKEVGVDSEMVFIRLVSAIEILSSQYVLNSKDNPLNDKEFSNLYNPSLPQKQIEQLKEILWVSKKGKIQINKSKQKFIKFVYDYSKGFLRGGNWKAKHVKITRKHLSSVLTAIYDGRSRYLHDGEPMYLSRFMYGADKWDTDPSFGMFIDNRKFHSSQKLPYTYWFEDVVRSCLLNYLKVNI